MHDTAGSFTFRFLVEGTNRSPFPLFLFLFFAPFFFLFFFFYLFCVQSFVSPHQGFLSVSDFLSVSVSVRLSLSLSLFVCLCLCLSLTLPVSIFVSVSLLLFHCLSIIVSSLFTLLAIPSFILVDFYQSQSCLRITHSSGTYSKQAYHRCVIFDRAPIKKMK